MKKITLAIFLILVLIFIFAFSKNCTQAAIVVMKLGSIDDFTPGTVKFIDKAKAFVICDDEGIYAISAVCTHLGCLLERNDNKFACPCHWSSFDANGKVVTGPATRDLAWYSLEIKDNDLFLDTSTAINTGTKLKYPQN